MGIQSRELLFPLPRQLQLLGLFFLLLFKDNRVDSIGVSGFLEVCEGKPPN